MRREGRDPVLKKSRWLLLRRGDNLADEQHFRLRDLLRYNLKTIRAYLLKEAFQQLWDYNSPTWAGKFLDLCGHSPYVAKACSCAVLIGR
jgi:transposase